MKFADVTHLAYQLSNVKQFDDVVYLETWALSRPLASPVSQFYSYMNR